MRSRILIAVLAVCICVVTYNRYDEYQTKRAQRDLEARLLHEWQTLSAKKKANSALAKIPLVPRKPIEQFRPVENGEKKPILPAA